MSLNLPQVLSQMQDMGRTAASRVEQLAVKLPEAVETFRRVSLMKPKHIQARIARAGNRWPGAVPTQEPLDLLVSPPTLPDQLKVIGADGSQIYPDRHAPAFYFMINIGSIIIAHGSGKPPQTNSRPWIYYQDEYLYDQNDGAITNAVVDGWRDVAEMGELARLADGCLGEPILALLDNGLLLWLALQVQGSKRRTVDRILRTYFDHLDRIHQAGAALAGFVDRPRSTNVLALLHLANLPLEVINQETLRANPYRGLTDRMLFAQLLSPGQRSSRFTHASPVNRDFQASGHEVQFFYLNSGEEGQIVRVEIPCWVAEQPELLNWVHAGILEQCRSTGGFPYALIRAHELALISYAERRNLDQMLQRTWLNHGLLPRLSQKSRTKKWIGQRRRHRL